MRKLEAAISYILWSIPNTEYGALSTYIERAKDDLGIDDPSEIVLVENAILETLFGLDSLTLHELLELYALDPRHVNKFGRDIYFDGSIRDLIEKEMLRRTK